MSIFSISLNMVGGICLYLGLLHLAIASRRLQSALHFSFGVTCLIAFPYILAIAAKYQATTVADYTEAMKLSVSLCFACSISTIWFVTIYTKVKPVLVILLLNILYLICLLLNQSLSTGILYAHIDRLWLIALPWGEQITQIKATINPLIWFQVLVYIAACSFVFYACFRQYRCGERQEAIMLGMTMGILSIAVQNDRLIDLGIIKSVNVAGAGYGFLILVAVMSLQLTNDVLQAAKLRQELIDSEKHWQALRQAAVAEERNRLACDLHDSVSQTLSSIVAIAQALPRIWEKYPEETRQGLAEVAHLSQGTLAQMRNLLVELRPSGLAEKPLGELLKQLTQAMKGQTHIEVTTIVECNTSLPTDVKLVFYRVTQEALNNIIKHANATEVSLTFQATPQGIQLQIQDNGCGFNPNAIAPGNLGLGIMAERVERIGANLNLASAPGEGTEIVVNWYQ